ncbi:MAG: putative methyltransferase [Frankiales bacterium]|nr:putative methyltransferase [Frankiales bacterium]
MQLLKRSYVGLMRLLGALLRRLNLLPETPPPTSKPFLHWAFTLTSIHDSTALARLDLPWWTYRAINEVDRWLADRTKPVRVFEYGSGASTIWLARRAGDVHSVEHHRAFGERMRVELRDYANADLQIVEPATSNDPAVPSAKEGHESLDFADYVASIDSVPGQFDLIVIDGRAREACLEAATKRLADDGIIVFDNSLRRRYRAKIRECAVFERRYFGLTPTLPYPDQTSILSLRP